MSALSRFASDRRGEVLKSVALSAAVIAFASLALTQLLDKATRDGSLPHVAIIANTPDPAARMAALPRPDGSAGPTPGQFDDTPVGTIAGKPMPVVVLDPCTGQNR